MQSITTILNITYLVTSFFYVSLLTLFFLKIPFNKLTVLTYTVYGIFSIAAQYWFLQYLSLQDVELCFGFIVHLPLILICWLIFNKNLIASVTALMLSFFFTCPRFVLGMGLSWLFPNLPGESFTGRIIVSLPLFILIVLLIKPIRHILDRSQKDILLFSFPLMTIYVLSYLLAIAKPVVNRSPEFIGKSILTLFICYTIYYIRIYFYAFDEKVELENRQHIINMSENTIRQQLKQMEIANEKTKAMRHDLRHFCNIINCYADAGNTDKIKEYISEIQTRTEAATIRTYCKNSAINLLLSSYLEPFYSNNVPVTTEIDVPEDLFISGIDLCIVLANTLENAYKACQYEEHPFLNLKLRTSPDRLFYQVQNSASGTITFENGCPVSHSAGHGVGTRSVALIAEKYHGLYDFHQADDIFTAKIILHSSK